MIRPARPEDIPALLAIWNPIIRETMVTFNNAEKSPADLAAMLAEKAAAGQPFLVAEGSGAKVLGFATYGAFRAGPGYRFTAEHTIILAPAARGQGLGRALMAALEAEARAAGLHILVAGVSGGNDGAEDFHRAIGFHTIARLPGVGFKFGRFWDLILMQKALAPPAPPEV